MSSKLKVKLNTAGVRELLRCGDLQDVCETYAKGIASRADGKWDVSTGKGRNRAYATVSTNDKDTFFRNLHTNTLLKAMK